MFPCLPSIKTLLCWSYLLVVGKVVCWERWGGGGRGRGEGGGGGGGGRGEGGEGGEDSEVAKLERWEGSEVTSWKRWDGGEVTRWEVNGFIQEWDMQGELKISSFCFWCNQWNERVEMGTRFSCMTAGMEILSLDLMQAVKNIVGCGSVWNS